MVSRAITQLVEAYAGVSGSELCKCSQRLLLKRADVMSYFSSVAVRVLEEEASEDTRS